MPVVHLRVVDAASDRALAVRVRVTDALGRACVPFGRPAVFRTGPGQDVGGQIRLGDAAWYYIDRGAEMVIPAGRVRVEVWHGFEHRPLVHETEIKTGQLSLRLTMSRWTDESASGWYSGDVNVSEIDPHAALLEAEAEDVAVVNLLARETEIDGAVRVSNLSAFSGAEPALQRGGCLVAVGTANRHSRFGTVALLGCHRPVFPLRAAGLDWSLLDWCDQAHRRKDGLVIGSRAEDECELLAAAILGRIDAVEMGHDIHGPAIVGGSGKECNRIALGGTRTYARLAAGETLSYRAWLDAVRAGRTYATSGPILTLQVEGVEFGGAVELPGPATVSVRAMARSLVPFRSLELVHDGEVIEAIEPTGDPLRASVETTLAIARSGSVTVRCRDDAIVAEGTPVRISVAGHPSDRSEWIARVRAKFAETRRWLSGQAAQPAPFLATLDAAEQRLALG